MRKPWWWLDWGDDASTREHDREDLVEVPTHFDDFGEPDEWEWCTPEAAAGWDASRWR